VTPNVSLPMYNLPEMRVDNARFWEALRELLVEAGLRDLPERLTFDRLPVPEGQIRAIEVQSAALRGLPARVSSTIRNARWRWIRSK